MARHSSLALATVLVMSLLGTARAVPVIVNPGFEADTFTTFPGYINQAGNGPITGWTASFTGNIGLNPISSGSRPFANNGAIPEGSQVAFIQSNNTTRTLSQSVAGFDQGPYVLTYRENSRAGFAVPTVSASVGGTTVVAPHAVPAVQGGGTFTQPYRYVGSAVFDPPTATETVAFTSTSTGDGASLIDQVELTPVSRLFSDNYNVVSNTFDINPNPANDEPGRQAGRVAPLTYSEKPTLPNYTQLSNGSAPDQLFVVASRRAGEEGTPVISLDHNFDDHSRYVLSLDVNPTNNLNGTDNNASGDWSAVIFGASSQLASVNTSDGIGFLIRGNGGYQVFDGTDGVNDAVGGDLGTDFGIDENGAYGVRINFDVPAFDDVTPGNVAIFVDDILVSSFTTDSGFANNFINLAAHIGPTSPADADRNMHAFDNVQIFANAVPEPMTASLSLLGLAALAARRRRG